MCETFKENHIHLTNCLTCALVSTVIWILGGGGGVTCQCLSIGSQLMQDVYIKPECICDEDTEDLFS